GNAPPRYVEKMNRDPSALIFVRNPSMPVPVFDRTSGLRVGKSVMSVSPATRTLPPASTAMPLGPSADPRGVVLPRVPPRYVAQTKRSPRGSSFRTNMFLGLRSTAESVTGKSRVGKKRRPAAYVLPCGSTARADAKLPQPGN